MGELAYMVRADWAQQGTAMVQNSAVMRDWVGAPPHFFTVTDTKKSNARGRRGDVEAAGFLAPEGVDQHAFTITDLDHIARQSQTLEHAIVVLHPFKMQYLEVLRDVILSGKLSRVFVLIWARGEIIKTWLDANGALNLFAGTTATTSDPLLLEAARMMIDEEYNGLESGRGKDAVVQLVRAFESEGYGLDLETWLRAYFAAGGTFHHAESITKLISEMQSGVKHRMKDRYVQHIFELIKKRAGVTTH